MVQQYVLWLLLWLVLLWSGIGCAPKQAVPPALSEHGYAVSLRASSDPIWLILVPSVPPGGRTFGELVVSVRDAQGRPVDGVPVEFELGGSWAQSAAVTPQRAVTHNGSVRAIVEPRTSGIVPVIVRVDNVTRKATFHAQSAPSSHIRE
jgi:hypothetical protein